MEQGRRDQEANTNSHTNSHTNTNPHTDTDTDTDTDTNTNTDANSYAYADTNAYAGPRRGEVDSDCDQGLDLGQRLLPQLQDRQLRWQVVDQLEADLHVA